ncbi:MAG: aminopeptidase [Spirochaetaceae bacterium]|jgi:aminopeptidase|nr:aminopeptidase [Spirochaetaceae bacterium]
MDKLDIYAKAVITSGINLRKGQCLSIVSGAENYMFARILAQEAYKSGAKFVKIEMIDNHLLLSRLENQDGEDLDYFPNYRINFGQEMLVDDWAHIRIDNTEEISVMKSADSEKLNRLRSQTQKRLQFVSKSLMKDEHPWCVIAIPGPKWAKSVLGEEATEEDLWRILKPILRLDREDPIAAWDEHNRSLHKRCTEYNHLKFDRIRFQSEGTDLTVGLSERSRWSGGPTSLPSGRLFNPNIPSEEIFTTPDWRRTEGRVKITRPVKVLEKQVIGAEFIFEKGKVVNFRADEGAESLKEYLETDDGAAYLGEVALVQNDSPISNSGKIFNSILFDENASCHIALGAGYPTCFSGYQELDSSEKLKEAGCNDSLVHTDFMLGAPDTTLTAYTQDGRELVIMKEGNFVL